MIDAIDTIDEPVWLFLDLETTGLDPQNDQILEVGFILVSQRGLVEIHRGSMVASASLPDGRLCLGEELPLSEVVRDMHTRSGLLAECDDSTNRSEDLEAFVLKALDCSRAPTKGISLAGYSVHFDLGFIRHQWPTLAARLSHRVVDVSTFRACLPAWGVCPVPDQKVAHRALADGESALSELRAYRDIVLSSRKP